MAKLIFQGSKSNKIIKRKKVSLRAEKELWKKGYKYVAGLDEAGRGPLAGPVVAGAVMLNSKFTLLNAAKRQSRSACGAGLFNRVKDSKKLSAKKREEFYKILTKHPAIEWGIGIVSEKIIDKINIKNAAELAMVRALKSLKLKPDFLIIDGGHVKNLKLKIKNSKLIVKADEKVFSCAAASILAKVTRDRIMEKFQKKFPRYGFDKHKGYPTREHIKRLKKYRPCRIHRMTFTPVLESLKRKA